MHWKAIVVFSQVTAMFFGNSEGQSTENTQSGQCPFSSIDLESLYGKNGPPPIGGYGKDNDDYSPFPTDASLEQMPLFPPDEIEYQVCSEEEEVECDPSSPYRPLDGSCNNLDHPTWGRAGDCQMRLLPPAYEGVDGLRISAADGGLLPEPRDLCNRILPDADRPMPDMTSMAVLFGQFLTHDIMQTPSPTRNFNRCCPWDAANQARPECAPIFVREDDPFYSQFNTTCLNFERSIQCKTCGQEGTVSQVNQVTAALDLSMVYSTSDEKSQRLRAKDGTGKLRSNTSDGQGELLLTNIGNFSTFCVQSIADKCFMTGDDRVDQHATLTSLHTIFMREHNRLAEALKQLNPHWGEERLYQEARKIQGGQFQNIVYNEYLPPTLGPRHMDYYGLWVDKPSRYNASVRPRAFLEVSTAGFRLHSLTTGLTGLSGLRFFRTFSNPGLVREGCVDELVKGATSVRSQQFDRYFVEDIVGQFLRRPGQVHGHDSNSIDIQRGRDHGMPDYGRVVRLLTQGAAPSTPEGEDASFDDLATLMTPQNIELLRENYASVHDIDLWVGLQLEKPVPGSILGLNSATLTALQFHHIKYGDRMYFGHRGQGAAFTKAQVKSLRKSSLARILCDNTNLKSIQKYPLLMPSAKNPLVDCKKIAKINLTPWKRNPRKKNAE